MRAFPCGGLVRSTWWGTGHYALAVRSTFTEAVEVWRKLYDECAICIILNQSLTDFVRAAMKKNRRKKRKRKRKRKRGEGEIAVVVVPTYEVDIHWCGKARTSADHYISSLCSKHARPRKWWLDPCKLSRFPTAFAFALIALHSTRSTTNQPSPSTLPSPSNKAAPVSPSVLASSDWTSLNLEDPARIVGRGWTAPFG
jgi:hypothetical protein